jgi:hypothetical protein
MSVDKWETYKASGGKIMILTRKVLKKYQENMRVYFSEEQQKEIIEKYGIVKADDDGHFREYTEQDVYEQLRKLF